MSKYAELDAAIISAIRSGKTYFFLLANDVLVKLAAGPFETHSRESWRAVDARLQALQRAGKIVYGGRGVGWKVVEGEA